jgi:hypothetical protein
MILRLIIILITASALCTLFSDRCCKGVDENITGQGSALADEVLHIAWSYSFGVARPSAVYGISLGIIYLTHLDVVILKIVAFAALCPIIFV